VQNVVLKKSYEVVVIAQRWCEVGSCPLTLCSIVQYSTYYSVRVDITVNKKAYVGTLLFTQNDSCTGTPTFSHLMPTRLV
jgi:hypothetical protein